MIETNWDVNFSAESFSRLGRRLYIMYKTFDYASENDPSFNPDETLH